MKLLHYHYPLSAGLNDLDRWFRSPSSGFGRLFDLAERLSDPVASTSRSTADLFEDEDHYFVRLEIPGVRKEEIDLELHDHRLSLSFERSRADREVPERVERVVAVPEGVDAGKVEARLEDGVLTVTLPKTPEVKPVEIKID